MGYSENAISVKLPVYKGLSFEDVLEFYQEMMKGKKYSIGIVGKASDMDMDVIKKLGRVVKLNKSKLFSVD